MPASDVELLIEHMLQTVIAADRLDPEGRATIRDLLRAYLNDVAAERGATALPDLSTPHDEGFRMALVALAGDAVYRQGLSAKVVGPELHLLADRWRPAPIASDAFEEVDSVRAACRELPALDSFYDVVIVGSGAGGGTAAREFATAGWRVLLVERGGLPGSAELIGDHARSPRASAGLYSFGGPSSTTSEQRTVPTRDGTEQVRANDPRWGNNAMTLGGGTRLYGAQAWRFTAEDFAMASTYGVPDGSALRDWPIGTEDLDPYYDEIEATLGLAGAGAVPSGSKAEWRLPALSASHIGRLLQNGAARLRWPTTPVPLLINSRPHAGRPACIRCSQCVGFECPVNARAGTHNTMIPEAAGTGNLTIALHAQVTRVLLDRTGKRASGVRVSASGPVGHGTRTIGADAIVLGAGAIETARLLLDSAQEGAPRGLGNDSDNVGRHLQGHLYGGATALFEDPVVDLVGPGPDVALTHTRHHNPGIVGGGMLANEFVPTPANTVRYLLDTGLVEPGSRIASREMESAMVRMARVMGPVQEVTTAAARVRIDRSRADVYGRSIVELSGSLHTEDYRVQERLADTAVEWLTAAGAIRVRPMRATSVRAPSPSVGQHQAGTCRMGDDPRHSVTDPMGRLWDCENVLVVDGSTHVTNGGVNPVLTILANSMRISRTFARASA
ncbi:GMC oxidoreductase [Ruania halotolerans]|uniref:GMC oxidoreductase n=1 Tax=Ruania halotolerans TaxID=2897773 RepID=UPI001E3A8546|nr:GMC family oxidoreductase [Ruania halotolerans]UFU06225.1 GMC family oxidoreductase [Ruania halotolerans]